MENKARRLITVGFMSLLIVLGLSAQKKELLTDPGTIEMRVVADLDAHQQSEDWAKWIEKNPVKGMFAFDITIWNKGEVVSVRALGRSDGATVEDQNALKNYVKLFKFDFKVPKGKRYKVTYNFMIE
jgi:hypothetical protein